MSVEAVLARISELDRTLHPQAPATANGGQAFASVLAGQSTGSTLSTGLAGTAVPVGWSGATQGGTAGQRALAAAQGEVGQTEQPPGSNDSPRIAEYRTATAGAGIGPWCSYFVSWAAKQAGAPVGEAGQGFGSVSALSAWAQRTGRFTPPGGAAPSPGDLVVWGGEHIGMVESVDADGKIHTIEGNSSNMVTRRVHDAGGDGATGFVRLG